LAALLLFITVLSSGKAGGADGKASYDVKMFGARGDGRTLDSAAIQSAIDRASDAGGGVVILSPGTYLSGSLHLRSHVELILEQDATLLGSTNRSDYVRGRRYALLLAEGQEDFALTGQGTINGQGQGLSLDIVRRVATGEVTSRLKPSGSPNENERPSIIEFRDCRHVKVTGLTVRDAACWTQIYANCTNLTMADLHVDSAVCENNDGVDIVDCRQVQIRHCAFRSEDDGICLKSDAGGGGCDGVEITDCRVCSLVCNGLKLGTASYHGFSNIQARNLTVDNTRRSAIALENVDGGVLEHVLVENVHGTNVGNAIFLRLGHRNTKAAVGQLQDIVIRDVNVEVSTNRVRDMGVLIGLKPDLKPAHAPDQNICPAAIVGLPGYPVKNVRLENIRIVFPGGGVPKPDSVPLKQIDSVAELPAKYPEFWMFGELPAWGFYLRHAEGIEFSNVCLVLKKAEFRPALVLDDVRRLKAGQLSVLSAPANPVLLLKDVSGAQFGQLALPASGPGTVEILGGCEGIEGIPASDISQ
jgi:hypothetical protein